MKKIFTFCILLCCLFKSFGIDYDQLSTDLSEWKDDCYAQARKNPFSCRINFHTDKFDKILSNGPGIASFLMMKLKNGNEELTIFLPKLFKTTFDSSYDGEKKVWIFSDYPHYIYYPPGFFPNKQKDKHDSIWIYWWDNGCRLTPEIFKQKYEAYQTAKKSDKKEDQEEAYTKLQNMGVIILPNILGKFEASDSDLIPMFCYLSDQTEFKNPDDCKKWWEANKEKYKDILDYAVF